MAQSAPRHSIPGPIPHRLHADRPGSRESGPRPHGAGPRPSCGRADPDTLAGTSCVAAAPARYARAPAGGAQDPPARPVLITPQGVRVESLEAAALIAVLRALA
jgi:hypothetical protein